MLPGCSVWTGIVGVRRRPPAACVCVNFSQSGLQERPFRSGIAVFERRPVRRCGLAEATKLAQQVGAGGREVTVAGESRIVSQLRELVETRLRTVDHRHGHRPVERDDW